MKIAHHVHASSCHRESFRKRSMNQWMAELTLVECFRQLILGGISAFLKGVINQTTCSFWVYAPHLLIWSRAENNEFFHMLDYTSKVWVQHPVSFISSLHFKGCVCFSILLMWSVSNPLVFFDTCLWRFLVFKWPFESVCSR